LNSAWLSATSTVTETTRTTSRLTNTVACKAKKGSKKGSSADPYGDPYGDSRYGTYGKGGGKSNRRRLESQRRRTKKDKESDLLPYCEEVVPEEDRGNVASDVPSLSPGTQGTQDVAERSCTAIADGTAPTTNDGVENIYVVPEPIEVTLIIRANEEGTGAFDPNSVPLIIEEYGQILQTLVAPTLAGCETPLSDDLGAW
jgi:hypothetical protein